MEEFDSNSYKNIEDGGSQTTHGVDKAAAVLFMPDPSLATTNTKCKFGTDTRLGSKVASY